MKFAEINAIFTATVAKYINNGYTFNTVTMSGHQGEIAKVDLRKGNDIIRVMLERENSFGKDEIYGDRIALTVGRNTDERVAKQTRYNSLVTMWDNTLEEIERREFWQMSGRDSDWYLEGAEGVEAVRRNNSRLSNRHHRDEPRKFPGKEKALLPAIRRHMNNPRLTVAKVDFVAKDSHGYFASVCGRRVKLG